MSASCINNYLINAHSSKINLFDIFYVYIVLHNKGHKKEIAFWIFIMIIAI